VAVAACGCIAVVRRHREADRYIDSHRDP
jgi:hypothetical protein